MNRRNDNEPYSFHPAGGNFLFADGHVSFLGESLDYRTALGLFTRAGGEILSNTDW
jgi:prepilin-type processing-associated H-X9-DG protein